MKHATDKRSSLIAMARAWSSGIRGEVNLLQHGFSDWRATSNLGIVNGLVHREISIHLAGSLASRRCLQVNKISVLSRANVRAFDGDAEDRQYIRTLAKDVHRTPGTWGKIRRATESMLQERLTWRAVEYLAGALRVANRGSGEEVQRICRFFKVPRIARGGDILTRPTGPAPR